MAYPKSTDPVKTRGISIPESLWEYIRTNAPKERRSASSYVTMLLFEAINARCKAQGIPAIESIDKLPKAKTA